MFTSASSASILVTYMERRNQPKANKITKIEKKNSEPTQQKTTTLFKNSEQKIVKTYLKRQNHKNVVKTVG